MRWSLPVPLVLITLGCGRAHYTPLDGAALGMDAGRDSGLDGAALDSATFDSATLDGDLGDAVDAWEFTGDTNPAGDAGTDARGDASAPRAPIDVCPAVLQAADWTQRAYVGEPGCSLNVTYEATGGNPGDRMRLELTGCPPTGQFAEFLEWNAQDLLEVRDGPLCRVDVRLDVLGGSSSVAGTPFRGVIGLSGILRGVGTTTGQWPSVFDNPPLDWTRGMNSVDRAGIDVGGADLDFSRPIHMTVGLFVDPWTSTPDQVIYFDNPCFHVVFDHDADGLCDDVDPVP